MDQVEHHGHLVNYDDHIVSRCAQRVQATVCCRHSGRILFMTRSIFAFHRDAEVCGDTGTVKLLLPSIIPSLRMSK
jgi:hypothetical protein